MLKRFIPNLFTFLNLFCGTVAVIFAVQGEVLSAGILVLLGIFFDFFDGFFARVLNVPSELGKQLDSLADMITSGVVPGLILFALLEEAQAFKQLGEFQITSEFLTDGFEYSSLLGLIFTLGAAYRLANFNIDTRQTNSFIGLPTPAATLVVVSLPFILTYNSSEFLEGFILNKWFLVGLAVVMTLLMNANLPLFSLKFKSSKLSDNKVQFVFLALAIVLLVTLKFIAVPLVILVYVLLSLLYNAMKKSKA